MTNFNKGLLAYLDASPTPFHAVQQSVSILEDAGFVAVDESAKWNFVPGGKYYVVRGDSSIIAFVHGKKALSESGIRMIGAHTDSPCLKVKPRPEKRSGEYFQLGVEVYGGALLNPWFDRDLSIAGRVSFKNSGGELQSELINFERPVAVVPSLAIHLDRTANDNRTINPQEHMAPILHLSSKKKDEQKSFRGILAEELNRKGLKLSDEDVLEYDLFFYDTQKSKIIGFNEEFIAGARLDNLLSCYIALQAIVQAEREHSSLVVLNDHEEVGSQSDVGARSNMLNSFIERAIPDMAERHQALANSMLFSVDNAHGVHPNYRAKHDENHGPIINAGPVLKVNANQAYATSSVSASMARILAEEVDTPLQAFVVRADMRCGSTIGPMTAAQTGIKTLDIGVPTFAMHYIRELAGVADSVSLLQLLLQFLDRDHLLK